MSSMEKSLRAESKSEEKDTENGGRSNTTTDPDASKSVAHGGFETGTDETLSVGNPIADFLRHQKANFKDMKEEEFMAKYNEYVKEKGLTDQKNNRPDSKQNNSRPTTSKTENLEAKHQNVFQNNEGNFKNIVLKFTTLSEGCYEAPSFTVDRNGAKIGRDASNDICVPSDQRLASESHAIIEYSRGYFHIIDGNCSPFAASVRIGLGNSHSKKWFLDKTARFSAGNSVLESLGMTETGDLELRVVEGPLHEKTITVTRAAGATLGRSSDNLICIPDKELSRKHTRIDYDEKSKRYIVTDMGSTNGTYIQLVGPYAGRYKLNLNDHILIGRTGFSVNRYDYGLSEEMGYRQAMEDACTIVQHLNIAPLSLPDLSPQSFFGVFDGHGGVQASHYLAQHLHVNVAHGLLDDAHAIFQTIDDVAPVSLYESSSQSGMEKLDRIIVQSLKTSFLQTDKSFINTSEHPQHGSTATTALILGKRLYCANVGDSRSMLCRNFSPICMSEDHKPTREDEAKRIRDAGGFVINNRVMGELAVSRAFGDVDFKKGLQSIIEEEGGLGSGSHHHSSKPSAGGSSNPGHFSARGSESEPAGDGPGSQGSDGNNWDQPLIIAEPDVKMLTISEEDQFLLLGCDGLFDVYTPAEVVTFVRDQMLKHGDAQKCCQSLTHDAIRKRNSRDNVSVILIILNKWY